MKLKFLLPACAAFAIIALGSCKKDSNSTDDTVAATFALSADEGTTANLNQDANDMLNEAAFQSNTMGSGFTANTQNSQFLGTGFLSCATVTVSPALGFPKTVTLDFGTGSCTNPNGITRSGIVTIVLSDSLRAHGSTATVTFNNYYVQGYKREGTITWTNTSTATAVSWHRNCTNGKITAPNGNYWTHSGDQDIVITAGASTPTLTDNVYSITGNSTVANSAGVSRTSTILTALEKKANCTHIDMGTVKVQGPNHYAVIDFGTGTCDNIATVSIDGHASQTITLP